MIFAREKKILEPLARLQSHSRALLRNVLHADQEWTNRTLAVHERVLVLPGSESTITEITEYIYFSPLKPRLEFKHKSE